jgi:L-alanine-DL-glutamate epimerase-like enolase superfamily enzyme
MIVSPRTRLTFAAARVRHPTDDGRTALLELTASDGTVGHASVSWSDAVEDRLRRACIRLLGQPVLASAHRFASHIQTASSNTLAANWLAYSAIENAAADLGARSLGVPLFDLLGGKVRDEVVVGVTVRVHPEDADHAFDRACRLTREHDVAYLVVRSASTDWQCVHTVLRALRDRFGFALRLRLALDARLSAEEHRRCREAMSSLRLECVLDRAACAMRHWRMLSTAVLNPAFHVLCLSASGWGGVPGLARAGATCSVFGREVTLSCDTIGGAEQALATHVALAIPSITMGIELPDAPPRTQRPPADTLGIGWTPSEGWHEPTSLCDGH